MLFFIQIIIFSAIGMSSYTEVNVDDKHWKAKIIKTYQIPLSTYNMLESKGFSFADISKFAHLSQLSKKPITQLVLLKKKHTWAALSRELKIDPRVLATALHKVQNNTQHSTKPQTTGY